MWAECIGITGITAFYVPRDSVTVDTIYGEDPLKTFTSSYQIDVYVSNYNQFQGQNEMFSKFGLQMHDDMTVLISRQTFQSQVMVNATYNRPLEGDLIWLPNIRGTGILYEIKYANPDADFNILGRKFPYYYELKLEEFKYSNEIIKTGQSQIDSIPTREAYGIVFALDNGNGINYILNETVYQGANLTSALCTAMVGTWDNQNYNLGVVNIAGVFTENSNIIGSVSNAVYELVTYDPLAGTVNPDSAFDNLTISTEGGSYLNTTEDNPFGI